MRNLFKVERDCYTGDNWLIGFGTDRDNHDYFITTDNVRASELWQFSGGAKFDAELIVKLLNDYYDKLGQQ